MPFYEVVANKNSDEESADLAITIEVSPFHDVLADGSELLSMASKMIGEPVLEQSRIILLPLFFTLFRQEGLVTLLTIDSQINVVVGFVLDTNT